MSTGSLMEDPSVRIYLPNTGSKLFQEAVSLLWVLRVEH